MLSLQTPCLTFLDARNCDLNERVIPIIGRSLRMGCFLTTLHIENTLIAGRAMVILGKLERFVAWRNTWGGGVPSLDKRSYFCGLNLTYIHVLYKKEFRLLREKVWFYRLCKLHINFVCSGSPKDEWDFDWVVFSWQQADANWWHTAW